MILRMLQFLQEDCPQTVRAQIIAMMQREWPQAFAGKSDGEIAWPDNLATQPTSFVLLADHTVICHVAVPWKIIQHEGESYKVFGLNEVMTRPAYRHQGLGLRLVKGAADFIEQSEADLSIFTCQPPLVSFYHQGGWEQASHTNLIGGTREKPFRSNTLGLATMIRFFSPRARQHRSDFTRADVYLELGENMLW
ncbi:GNAT family N-acetyltransferase [Dictyobacter formicarum]|uniref:N-acetyltransferase domain-containing protein n=1 Tax=Dictyobacter formicarum TaxID=2778368 RepID=A0ABQ3VJX1_9CHLR|nr:GNAT family N-acetyltransferase [Dictyobacter formicarum]GHO85898.1 hypothetical protein KSZ_39040 [Dictyobacter formicarum]